MNTAQITASISHFHGFPGVGLDDADGKEIATVWCTKTFDVRPGAEGVDVVLRDVPGGRFVHCHTARGAAAAIGDRLRTKVPADTIDLINEMMQEVYGS